MKWKHDVSEDYKENRDSLMNPFPEAHRFLMNLEELHDKDEEFHFGTAKNLHFYHRDRFLFYLEINKRGAPFPNVVFSSKQHINIKVGTHPDPDLFFVPLSQQPGIWGGNTAKIRGGDLIVVTPGIKCAPFFQTSLDIVGSLRGKIQ